MAAPGNNWEFYKKRITEILGSEDWQIINQKGKEYDLRDLKPVLVTNELGYYFSVFHLKLKTKSAFGPQEYYADQAIWTLSSMPAQCGMLISSNTNIYKPLRRGLGTLMNQLRQDIARNLGYTTLICTNQKENKSVNQELLGKLGWKEVYSFKNDRTKNLISVNIVQLID